MFTAFSDGRKMFKGKSRVSKSKNKFYFNRLPTHTHLSGARLFLATVHDKNRLSVLRFFIWAKKKVLVCDENLMHFFSWISAAQHQQTFLKSPCVTLSKPRQHDKENIKSTHPHATQQENSLSKIKRKFQHYRRRFFFLKLIMTIR